MTDECAALKRADVLLDLQLDDAVCSRLLQYLALLRKWNRSYNLTAVREPHRMLTHHLFDSLATVRPLQREIANSSKSRNERKRLLDIGSGAGLPGSVLAICCPDLEVICIDAVAKKTAFIRQTAAELALANLHALHGRVETLQVDHYMPPFDAITARAFAALDELVACSAHLLAEHGCWLAMKGRVPTAEIEALPASIEVFHVEQLKVPQVDEQRCIVWMRKKSVGTA